MQAGLQLNIRVSFQFEYNLSVDDSFAVQMKNIPWTLRRFDGLNVLNNANDTAGKKTSTKIICDEVDTRNRVSYEIRCRREKLQKAQNISMNSMLIDSA